MNEKKVFNPDSFASLYYPMFDLKGCKGCGHLVIDKEGTMYKVGWCLEQNKWLGSGTVSETGLQRCKDWKPSIESINLKVSALFLIDGILGAL